MVSDIISIIEKEISNTKRANVIDVDYLCVVNGFDPEVVQAEMVGNAQWDKLMRYVAIVNKNFVRGRMLDKKPDMVYGEFSFEVAPLVQLVVDATDEADIGSGILEESAQAFNEARAREVADYEGDQED